MMKTGEDDRAFRVFRYADSPGLDEVDCQEVQPFAPELSDIVGQVLAAGLEEGQSIKVLFNIAGFSLTHVWFKTDYPLPLHSHNVDCLYYVVAGQIRLGNEDLEARDGFFVPADVPYSYRTGPEGVELLEFRNATRFDFVNHAKGQAFWAKALDTVEQRRGDWASARRPALKS